MVVTAELASFIVCCIAAGNAVPTPQNDSTAATVGKADPTSSGEPQGHITVAADSHATSSANGFTISVTENRVNDQCTTKLSIIGNGIDKTAEYPCGKKFANIINMKNGLVVDDEWFTDEPKTLVHLTGKQCQKEVFTEKDGQTTSTTEPLSEDECKKVHEKISQLKKEQEELKHWMYQQQQAIQQAMQQQVQKLQENAQWLQHHLFSNLFGGK